MGFEEEIREFLIESNELLTHLDQQIVQLEQTPNDPELVSSAFRAIHTIKGTSGFFGFEALGALTHVTENVFTQVRDGHRELTPELISLILSALDQVKESLAKIAATGLEDPEATTELCARLDQAYKQGTRHKPKEPAHEAASGAVPLVSPGPESASQEGPQTRGGFQPLRSRRARFPNPAPDAGSPGPESAGAGAAVLPDASLLFRPEPVSTPVASANTGNPRSANAQLDDSTIRVDVGLLNRLMNLVGELVLARNQLLQESSAHTSSLQQTSQRLNLITSELQEGVMKTRMQPIGVVWNKLPRVVRDLATQCGKKIRMEMHGVETELDKTIIEAIKDPLTHVVRNCCDHGIESPETRIAKGKAPEGLIQLRAYHEGGVVNIEIVDDGAGIDPERVKAKAVERGILRAEQAAQMTVRDALHVIFLPGFSTAAEVTSISGRGVGMDVVKNNIEKIGGNVEVLARSEGGTTIRIKIPLTLAIIPGLVVTLDRRTIASTGDPSPPAGPCTGRVADDRWREQERFIIPQANLLELVRIPASEQDRRIDDVHGTAVFHHRGKLLPLLYLNRVLGQRHSNLQEPDAVNIVVLQAENRKMALVVDRICDTQEIVVKPLGRQLKGLSCYVGATIMGDGRTALILDVVGLMHLGGISAQHRTAGISAASNGPEIARSQKLLIFRSGVFERVAVSLALVDRLEEVDASAIRRAAGRRVLHYRGEILPLIALPELMVAGSEVQKIQAGLQQVIVFSDGRRRTGVLVDQIIDIVEEVITARRGVSAPGILGSALIGGHVTDLLDLEALLTAAGEGWMRADAVASGSASRLLLVEGRTAARELLHGFLETSGYNTVSVGTIAEAVAELDQRSFDLALTSIDVAGTPGAGLEFLRSVRKHEVASQMPVIAMLRPARGSARQLELQGLKGFEACVYQDQRDDLLNTLTALLTNPKPRMEKAAG